MNRRELLASSGALVGAVALGGCLSRYEEVAGEAADATTTGGENASETTTEETTRETTEETTAETTTTRGQPPALTGKTFELLDGNCGEPTNAANVTVEEQGTAVEVEGTIPGSNACYVARLANASYDPETGTLEVTVASMQKEDAGACAQCIVEIDYRAAFAFENGLPERVTVVHEAMGETTTVTTARPGEATTTAAETTTDSA